MVALHSMPIFRKWITKPNIVRGRLYMIGSQCKGGELVGRRMAAAQDV